MSHTPGPWGREDKENPEMITAGCFPDGSHIYVADTWDTYPNEERAEANARLIAAAPEMLEALEELCAAVYSEEFDALITKTLGLIERIKEDNNA